MEQLFNDFTEETGIRIPQNIKELYLDSNNSSSEFVRLFKANFQSSKNPQLSILISEKFVLEILNLINNYPENDRYGLLFRDLETYDTFYKGKKMKPDLDSEKLLIEEILYYVSHYDYKNNQFKFPIIQRTYEKLNSNQDLMKVILILYGSCGGEGGIIVRGENVGHDCGYAHGEMSEIKMYEDTIEYRGYSSIAYERSHLAILENHRK